MSEKIGLARAEIVDLLSLILRTHSRDELFSLFRSAEGITPKEDPEAWREENLKKQAAGVKFEVIGVGGFVWLPYVGGFKNGNKEHYREVPQDDLNLKQTGDKQYKIQIEQPAIGVISSFNKWDRALTEKEISDLFSGKLRPEDIPQEAPKMPIPHAAERALWKAQRDAGNNDVWQVLSGNGVADILVDVEPNWHPDFIYRVKPMRLTAKIIRREVYKTPYGWEFFGTREEYRAECEKYGYVVISEIKEVVEKPKTVKCYVVTLDSKRSSSADALKRFLERGGLIVIGDIEEREIEA